MLETLKFSVSPDNPDHLCNEWSKDPLCKVLCTFFTIIFGIFTIIAGTLVAVYFVGIVFGMTVTSMRIVNTSYCPFISKSKNNLTCPIDDVHYNKCIWDWLISSCAGAGILSFIVFLLCLGVIWILVGVCFEVKASLKRSGEEGDDGNISSRLIDMISDDNPKRLCDLTGPFIDDGDDDNVKCRAQSLCFYPIYIRPYTSALLHIIITVPILGIVFLLIYYVLPLIGVLISPSIFYRMGDACAKYTIRNMTGACDTPFFMTCKVPCLGVGFAFTCFMVIAITIIVYIVKCSLNSGKAFKEPSEIAMVLTNRKTSELTPLL